MCKSKNLLKNFFTSPLTSLPDIIKKDSKQRLLKSIYMSKSVLKVKTNVESTRWKCFLID